MIASPKAQLFSPLLNWVIGRCLMASSVACRRPRTAVTHHPKSGDLSTKAFHLVMVARAKLRGLWGSSFPMIHGGFDHFRWWGNSSMNYLKSYQPDCALVYQCKYQTECSAAIVDPITIGIPSIITSIVPLLLG